jgi:hypothetical protein
MVAFLAAVPAVAFLLAGPLRQVQREGVERHVLLRLASAAFFATMAAALAYGLLEAFAGVAPLSAWWCYGLGLPRWHRPPALGSRVAAHPKRCKQHHLVKVAPGWPSGGRELGGGRDGGGPRAARVSASGVSRWCCRTRAC